MLTPFQPRGGFVLEELDSNGWIFFVWKVFPSTFFFSGELPSNLFFTGGLASPDCFGGRDRSPRDWNVPPVFFPPAVFSAARRTPRHPAQH